VAILSDSYARGALELEEFERRVEAAHRAGSVGELAALIEDLPEPVHSEAEGAGGSPAAREVTLSGEDQPVYAILANRRLRGEWLESRQVDSYSLMSNTEYDFRETALPREPVELRVFALMSSILVTVPEGVPVRVDVMPVLADCREGRGVRRSLVQGQPGIRITGTIVMSNLTVRVR
jgi:hypothetical protein